MLRINRVIVVVAIAAVLVSLGGCVSSSTHNKTLASLEQTRGQLQQEHATRTMFERDNNRLKAGLATLSDRCKSAQTQIQAVNAAMARIKVGEKHVATAMDNLYQLVTTQAGSTAALAASSFPLAADIDDIQARAASLLENSAVQPDGLNDPAALRVSVVQRGNP